MKCRVTFQNGNYFCVTDFEGRELPKSAGFRFTKDANGKIIWFTPFHVVASRLREHFDTMAQEQISRSLIEVTPWTGALSPPPEGLSYYEHQSTATLFSLARNRSYLGLDPGLGKTIVAAMIANATGQRAVYICPPFLTLNTEEEFKKWAPHISVGRYGFDDMFDCQVLIVPDSLLIRDETIKDIKRVRLHYGAILPTQASLATILIVDEAHRYKNLEAKRTRALLGHHENMGIVDYFNKIILMSGTPMPNRPMELYPILNKLAPETIDFMNKFEYAKRYCGAYHNGHGWDFSGASHVKELAGKVIAPTGNFMLRLRKDILNLPPVIEEVLVLENEMSPVLAKMDTDVSSKCGTKDGTIKAILAESEGKSESELHLATYRRLLGQEKVAPAATYIKSILEETDEAVLIFAIHKDVIESLSVKLAEYRPLVITGNVPKDARHGIAKEFQENKDRRVFIGNIQAAGIGFTLTKATRVIFVEFEWVPGSNDQARDRAHRIGTKHTVYAQFLVYKNSIDKSVIDTILKKKKSTDHI